MYVPLGVKTDYSLLQSLIKIPDLMMYLKKKDITTCGILDDNLFSSMCFYDSCIQNGIKPIIGLVIKVNGFDVYLYAKNYDGYKNLMKIHTLKQTKDITYIDLKGFKDDLICIVPYKSNSIFNELSKIYKDLYVSYVNDFEKKNGSLLTDKLVYLFEARTFSFKDIKYLAVIREIDTGEKIDIDQYNEDYLEKDINDKSSIEFSKLIDLVIPKDGRYIPVFDKSKDSYKYLATLCKKGLEKRFDGKVEKKYIDRLEMELNVIKSMGFVDYFLIVYDYVKFAKTHDILVGPGRGSAAGSLVSYCLGITNVDPIKYDLLFERFLNPERITMPDIDIDFEYTKRDQVIDYVKGRYGKENVANIMTFGTLGARQVIRDVGKVFNVSTDLIDKLSNMLDPRLGLEDNLKNKHVSEFVSNNKDIKKIYQVSFKIEGLKRHISTHAAGVVISSVELDSVIPVFCSGEELLTGCTMEYLEELGLLKMDFLALKNLTIIQNVVELIEKETGNKINLNNIPLDDKKTMEIFKDVDTEGIFQFESSGMKNFLSKLKPDTFSDLIAAVALFRPGPMENIDTFIKRKQGKERIVYPDDSLIDILEDTYGIMIYQEQIMLVLVKMANYTFAEADNIRRAMSKKKKEVMEKEREIFVSKAMKNGYTKEKCEEVYDLIVKFANYGFNKAHSVSYALIGYQMAYLKANYSVYFIANLLNMSIGSDVKTKEYLDEAKSKDIKVFKPNINVSTDSYLIKDNALLLPLNVIHNVGGAATQVIINERQNGRYTDFFNFVARTYGKGVNKKTLEFLIDADCFRDFDGNHRSLHESIDAALDYASLCSDLDESLVMKPDIKDVEEYNDGELMNRELSCLGFYVTNHPASKYQEGIMKLHDIKNFFDKFVTSVVIIGSIRKIKTKKGEDMGFILGSDETDNGDFIVFPKNYSEMLTIKNNDLVRIKGQVTRRNDKFQIVVSKIEKI